MNYDYKVEAYVRELKENIREYKRDLEIIENVKRVKRKNGDDFKNLTQNFIDVKGYHKLYIEKDLIYSSRLKVGGVIVTTIDNKILENTTAEDIENLIKERIIGLRKNIKDAEDKIQKIDTIAADVEKVRDEIQATAEKYQVSKYKIIEML